MYLAEHVCVHNDIHLPWHAAFTKLGFVLHGLLALRVCQLFELRGGLHAMLLELCHHTLWVDADCAHGDPWRVVCFATREAVEQFEVALE